MERIFKMHMLSKARYIFSIRTVVHLCCNDRNVHPCHDSRPLARTRLHTCGFVLGLGLSCRSSFQLHTAFMASGTWLSTPQAESPPQFGNTGQPSRHTARVSLWEWICHGGRSHEAASGFTALQHLLWHLSGGRALARQWPVCGRGRGAEAWPPLPQGEPPASALEPCGSGLALLLACCPSEMLHARPSSSLRLHVGPHQAEGFPRRIPLPPSHPTLLTTFWHHLLEDLSCYKGLGHSWFLAVLNVRLRLSSCNLKQNKNIFLGFLTFSALSISFFPFNLVFLANYINRFSNAKPTRAPETNPTWLWCSILFRFCWIVDIFAHISLSKNGL